MYVADGGNGQITERSQEKMMNAIEKLNEALSTMTTEQMGLEGDDLLNSLKAVKSVVKAIETLAKIGKAMPTEPTEPPTDKAEPEFTEEIPAEAVENVEQEVEQATDDMDAFIAEVRKTNAVSEASMEILRKLVGEAEDNSMFTIWGGEKMGWCDYSLNKIARPNSASATYNNDGMQYYINEMDLLNPAYCRGNSRHHITAYNDGRLEISTDGKSGTLRAAVIKRRGKPSCLCIYKEEEQKIVANKAVGSVTHILKAGMDDLKKAIFG